MSDMTKSDKGPSHLFQFSDTDEKSRPVNHEGNLQSLGNNRRDNRRSHDGTVKFNELHTSRSVGNSSQSAECGCIIMYSGQSYADIKGSSRAMKQA